MYEATNGQHYTLQNRFIIHIVIHLLHVCLVNPCMGVLQSFAAPSNTCAF